MNEFTSNFEFGRSAEMATPKVLVRKITSGFEFGHGKISGVAANRELLLLVDDMIQNNPDIIVPIDADDDGDPVTDDGCGDGREVLTVFSLDHQYKRSLNRSKVFGGSATMAMASTIALGETESPNLNEVFQRVIADLDSKNMDFGAHSDEHMHGKNCGCGAIDHAPAIIMAAVKYEMPIRGSVTLLAERLDGLNEVYRNFRNYVPQMAPYVADYNGREVLDAILQSQNTHIVKQLGGAHKECRIVLNTVRNFTVNQKLIRSVTDNQAQIFGVDVWRMQDIASNLYSGQPERQQKAFLGELIYTIATAAVLTKGDLPVDVIEAVE